MNSKRIPRLSMTLIGQCLCLILITLIEGSQVYGAAPNAVLTSVFPPGGQAGTTVTLTIAGSALTNPTSLRCCIPAASVESAGPNQFRLSIPKDTPPGQYDLQAVTDHGLSSMRTFVVGNRVELLEQDPNDSPSSPRTIPLETTINGRIEKGDLDHFAFTARQGQHVIVACQAEQIDSRLRPVLELYDSSGRRVAVNRGWMGTDPLIEFLVPADGTYVVKLFDLIYSGGADHFYRLSVDTAPRVVFTVPNAIERGKTSAVTLYGWNLRPSLESNQGDVRNSVPPSGTAGSTWDSITVEITAPREAPNQTVRVRSAQVSVDSFPYYHSGSSTPVQIGLADSPVLTDPSSNHSAGTAGEVPIPCEISGQLAEGGEQDWYAVQVRRGEVLWLEAFGERLGSPVDLAISVYDPSGERELTSFQDEVKLQSPNFPTNHSDPIGRWVAPADGRYLILIRNVIGESYADPCRQYRLSLRREEPDFHLVVVPRHDTSVGVNVPRGGTCLLDVLAVRRRGLSGAIRVSAKNLPPGVECPDIWLGPDVNAAPLTISAGRDAAPSIETLQLEGAADLAGTRRARGGTIVSRDSTGITGRITQDIAYSVVGAAPLKLVANPHEIRHHQLYGDLKPRHSPGSVVDIVVEIERSASEHQAAVRLIGIGVPAEIANQTVTIPAGMNRGTLSFYLPSTLPIGKYTWAVQGETTVPTGPKDPQGNRKPEPEIAFSNTVTIDVQPAAFVVEIDPFTPRKIRRGQVLQVNYSARRINGFIGKIHTELDAPGEVVGLRGRGVTFVGQSETGNIQIIANDDAPLGQQPFLRLHGVGTLEDQPAFQGHQFLNLEVIE